MCKTIDMISQKFGMWTVLEKAGVDSRKALLYRCQCECGTIKEVVGYSLRRGQSTNCGCKSNKKNHAPAPMVGRRFGRWEVLEKRGKDSRGALMYLCRCTCGKEKEIVGYSLRKGDSTSCGCYAAEKNAAATKTQKANTYQRVIKAEYQAWLNIKARCKNPNSENYKNYGGRGITICDEWDSSFDAFYDYVGPRSEGASLDRIDVNGNYEPGNVRWANEEEQCNNRTNARQLTYGGKTMTIAQWSRETGLKYNTIRSRIERNWSPENALTTPEK